MSAGKLNRSSLRPCRTQKRMDGGQMIVGPEVIKWFAQGRMLFPDAETLGRLAAEWTDFVAGETLTPIYLRETNFVKAPPPRFLSA